MKAQPNPHERSHYLTRSWLGWLVLLLPVLGIGLALTEVAFAMELRARFTQRTILFVQGVVLLDFLHVGLPFSFVLGTLDGRRLLRGFVGDFGKLWRAFTAGAALLAGFLCIYANVAPFVDVQQSALFKITVDIFFIAPTWHALKQSWGLSRVLESRYQRVRGTAGSTFNPIQLFNLLTLVSVLNLLTVMHEFSFASTSQLRLFFSLTAFVCALGIFVQSARSRPNLEKILFNLRFFIYPMLTVSLTAVWTVLIVHALEYLHLYGHILSPCPPAERRRAISIASGFAGLLLVICILQFWVPTEGFPILAQIFLVSILSLRSLLTLLHYALDRYLYRFRDANVRSTFEALLGEGQLRQNV